MKGTILQGEAKAIKKFKRWRCGKYPATGYPHEYKYEIVCELNMGMKVAFYEEAAQVITLLSGASANQALAQNAGAMRAPGVGSGLLGGLGL